MNGFTLCFVRLEVRGILVITTLKRHKIWLVKNYIATSCHRKLHISLCVSSPLISIVHRHPQLSQGLSYDYL